mgnify:CR=1 FL=1
MSSTRSGRKYKTTPVSSLPKPIRSRANSQSSAHSDWSVYRRQNSSSTEEGDGDESVSSILETPPASTRASSSGNKVYSGRKAGSSQKNRSNSSSLKEFEQKIIACDAEDWEGGLEGIFQASNGVTIFCDTQAQKDEEREHLYAAVSSKQRERVRSKLRYWRDLQQKGGEYHKLLGEWEILPAAYRNLSSTKETPAPKPTPKQQPQQGPRSSNLHTPATTEESLLSGIASLSINSPAIPTILFNQTMNDHPQSKLCSCHIYRRGHCVHSNQLNFLLVVLSSSSDSN